MGLNPKREQTTCGQPLDPQGKVALNELDDTQGAETHPGGDQYAARHNPFVYFHSLIDSGECARHVVNFNQLAHDLQHESTTPNFVFITPNLCHDGHDGTARSRRVKTEKSPTACISAVAWLAPMPS